jgi:hypothetical protein
MAALIDCFDRLRRWISSCLALVPLVLLVFLVFLVIYGLTAGVSLGRHSLAPHFVYLAESFLHGRLDLLHVPDPQYDLTPFEGRWYVSFPPLPALLILPLVALRGLSVSDVAFSVVLGAFGTSLFYAALARLRVGGLGFNLWLCLLLGLGTPLWYCAALGSVWYTAHVVAVACLCLYVLEVMGLNRPWLAGLWLGLGFLARAPVVLAFPLALALGLSGRDARGKLRFLVLYGLGMLPALVGQAAYNWARFGGPLEFGYRWMDSPGPLLGRQVTWGQFSLHFLPENLYTLLVRPPLVQLAPLRVEPDPWGMGLLFACPALLLALRGLRRDGRARPAVAAAGVDERALRLGLWASVALVQLPSLLYFNTGSYQFGYRFALDWMPLGILLVALGAGGRLRWWDKALIIVSVVMHGWGMLWMYPNFNGQPWHLQYIEVLQRLFR